VNFPQFKSTNMKTSLRSKTREPISQPRNSPPGQPGVHAVMESKTLKYTDSE